MDMFSCWVQSRVYEAYFQLRHLYCPPLCMFKMFKAGKAAISICCPLYGVNVVDIRGTKKRIWHHDVFLAFLTIMKKIFGDDC